MRILVKDDMVISGSDSSQANGIYEVLQVGGTQGESKLEIIIQNDGDSGYDADAAEKIMFEFDGDIYEIGFSTTVADSTAWSAAPLRQWNIRTNKTKAQMVTAIKTALSANPLGTNTNAPSDSQGSGNQNRSFRSEGGSATFDGGNALITLVSSNSAKEFELMEGEFNAQFKVSAFPKIAADARTVLKRAADADALTPEGTIMAAGTGDLNPGAFCFVEQGFSFADCGFVMSSDFDVEHQNQQEGITFVQFSAAGQIIPGDGIAKSGQTISADLKANGGLVIESAKIAVDLAASNISGQLALTDIASIAAARLLVGPNGGGAPVAVDVTGDVTISDSGVTAIGVDKVQGTMLHTSAADAVTMELSSDSLSVLKVPNDLTVDGATLEFISGTEYNGSGARSVRVKNAGLDARKLKYIEARHIATGNLANTELTHAQLTYAANSPVTNIDDLVSAVNGTNSQSLNQGDNVKVYLNGLLLTPDFSDDADGDSDFDLGTADYKFYVSGSNLRIKFNGDIVENEDIIRISGLAVS